VSEHTIKIAEDEQVFSVPWHRWECSCGSKGNWHPARETAELFGADHVRLSRPYVEELKS